MPSLNGQKWMWHLCGIENARNTKLTVVRFHKESETVHQILIDGWTTVLVAQIMEQMHIYLLA